MTKVAVVFNPSKASDPQRARRDICEALRANGFDDPLWLETTPEDPGEGQARSALERGAEIVFASGGDGTVMACAGVLAGTKAALAVLPAGTGNLLARNFGIPLEVSAAVASAVRGVDRRIDVGVLGDRRFVIMAGLGFDAQMLADAPEGLKSRVGWPAYIVSGARHLLEPRRTFTVTVDDAPPVERPVEGCSSATWAGCRVDCPSCRTRCLTTAGSMSRSSGREGW